MRINFCEPIFVHNGENSRFFNAKKISPLAIFAELDNLVKDEEEYEIEFSLPGSEHILKATIAVLIMDEKEMCLKIRKMSKNDIKILEEYTDNFK